MAHETLMIAPNMDPDAVQQAAQVNLIYDDYRTMLLNKKYYGSRLEVLKRNNLIIEFLIAAGATGSGVAGFAVWQQQYGALAWAIISGISIILAIAKPLLRLPDRIEIYSKLYGEYAGAFQSLKMLVGDLQVSRSVSDARLKNFIQIRNRTAELAKLNDPNPSRKFIRVLELEVNAEIIIDQLWLPQAANPKVDVVSPRIDV